MSQRYNGDCSAVYGQTLWVAEPLTEGLSEECGIWNTAEKDLARAAHQIMISAECFWGLAPVAMLWESCLLFEGPGNEQNACSFCKAKEVSNHLTVCPSRTLLSLFAIISVMIPHPAACLEGEEWHKVYLAEHYICAGELAVIDASISWSPASCESGHWMPYGSGQIFFHGLLFHAAQLRGVQHLCDLVSPVEFSSNWSKHSKVIPPMLAHT